MDQDLLQLAVQLRHTLHAHPEVSGQERWTRRYLMDFLREHSARLEIIDRGEWFYAKYPAGEGRPSAPSWMPSPSRTGSKRPMSPRSPGWGTNAGTTATWPP